MKTPDTLAAIVLLAGLAIACARLTVGCAGASLTPDDQAKLGVDGIRIGVCQQKGRECKRTDAGGCFEVYDDCMADAGFR